MILYVETNFPMSIATGRDPEASTLLLSTPASVRLVIPSVCYMEALSALDADLKARRRFNNELDIRLSDARRNLSSQYARSLGFHLEQARIENKKLTDEVKESLFEALTQLARKAESIALSGETLQASLRQNIAEDPTDDLILQCILDHARLYPAEVKVFLSGNSNDFDTQSVREALRNAGVENYFNRTQNFLNWLQLQ
ncbi:PIN domain-containing protein [Aerosakkonema funiforme]|uniref:DUF4935 domain-containing protein n=1 Tax=Aerosakkonema funiforme FACHB-1375 TaxID=2949571 RepID=A0A926VKN4_9CYAN|nr:DUF4935 domain-containing protein [Aerosakkonema funiforme FACHB-1375]